MPNPYPIELRERAVRAYDTGADSYATVADRFSVNRLTLLRWVQQMTFGVRSISAITRSDLRTELESACLPVLSLDAAPDPRTVLFGAILVLLRSR